MSLIVVGLDFMCVIVWCASTLCSFSLEMARKIW